MSTPFYDLASLVLVPSGYKAQKVYAQKPLTTDGQLTFSRASTATRVNSAGLIETVSSNVPRLDYQGSTCPKLLLEPQRVNLALQSSAFDNASWIKYELTVTANATTAPDGTISADLILDNNFNDAHAVYQAITAGAGVYTWSVFAKAQNLNFLIISAYTGSHNRTWFNLSNGTVGTNEAGNTATITSVGNGWYKCSVSRSYTSGTFVTEISPSNANGVSSYVGSGNGIYVWGAQVEQGAYSTSLIPTTTAAVTRLADMSGTTNYFGAQTFAGNFTFFVDLLPMEGNTATSDAMILGGGDYNGGGDYQSYFRFASGNIILKGVAEVGIIDRSYTMTANQQYKILVTRTGTTVKIFANGAQVGASATSSATVILRSLGWSYTQANYNYDGRINQVLLMPSGLTDAQAIELTTL